MIKLAINYTKRVPGIALPPIFRLRNYFLLCNKFSLPLLLLALLGIIGLVFNIIAVLDIVGYLIKIFWCGANFVTRKRNTSAVLMTAISAMRRLGPPIDIPCSS